MPERTNQVACPCSVTASDGRADIIPEHVPDLLGACLAVQEVGSQCSRARMSGTCSCSPIARTSSGLRSHRPRQSSSEITRSSWLLVPDGLHERVWQSLL